MPAASTEQATSVVPTMRYRDADAAITWLETVLGFKQYAVYRDPQRGHVVHAELRHTRANGATGMVMLGSTANESDMATHYVQPDEAGGVTSGAYVIVDDCGTLYPAAERAVAQAEGTAAAMLMTLRTMEYGGQAFAVRDPEGHIWSVGEYDPFAKPGSQIDS